MDCVTESLTLYHSDCDVSFVVRWKYFWLQTILYVDNLQFWCVKQIKNLYFRNNEYYYDTRINDYNCNCLNNRCKNRKL